MGVKPDPKSELGFWFSEEKSDLEPGVNSLVELWIRKNWTKTNHDFQNLNQIFFVWKYWNLCMEPEVEPFELVRTGPKPTRTWTRFFSCFEVSEFMHGTRTGTKIVLILSKKLEVLHKRRRNHPTTRSTPNESIPKTSHSFLRFGYSYRHSFKVHFIRVWQKTRGSEENC